MTVDDNFIFVKYFDMTNQDYENLKKATEFLTESNKIRRAETRELSYRMVSIISAFLFATLAFIGSDLITLSLKAFICVLASWAFFIITLILGFIFLYKETVFESTTKLIEGTSLYDQIDINDKKEHSDTKNEMLLALSLLKGKRFDEQKYLSKDAQDIIEKHKKTFKTWSFLEGPEDVFNTKNKKNLDCIKFYFFKFAVVAVILFITAIVLNYF